MEQTPKYPPSIPMEELARITNSPAGKQLIAMLRQKGGDDLQNAMEQAAAGNMDGAKTALSSLLRDPGVAALLNQLGK